MLGQLHTFRLLLVGIALLTSVTTHAEDLTLPPADTGNVTVNPPGAPTVTNPEPAPQPDRANNNGAAKALAMAGAAMAMVGCMKLMKEAREAKAAGDTQTAAMLESMAMQQCAQAMKDMAEAAKNDDNKKQLTMNDTPKMSQLQAQPFPSQAPSKEKQAAAPSMAPAPEESTEPWPEMAPTVEVEKRASDTGETKKTEVAYIDDPFTTLNPIDPANLKFDDTAKAGQTTNTGTGSGNAVSAFVAANGRAPTADELKKLNDDAAAKERAYAANGNRGDNIDGGGGADGGSGSSKGGDGDGKDDPFKDMFGSLFGGPQAGAANPFGTGQSGTELVAFSTKDKKSKLNIFQFASRQYSDLTFNKGKVRARIPRQAPQGLRDLASVN